MISVSATQWSLTAWPHRPHMTLTCILFVILLINLRSFYHANCFFSHHLISLCSCSCIIDDVAHGPLLQLTNHGANGMYNCDVISLQFQTRLEKYAHERSWPFFFFYTWLPSQKGLFSPKHDSFLNLTKYFCSLSLTKLSQYTKNEK